MVMAHAFTPRWSWMLSETHTRTALKGSQSLAKLQDSMFVSVIAPGLSDDRGLDRFWLRAIKVSSPASQTRFITSFSEYVFAVIDEASDRAKGHVRGTEDYLKLTRLTAGGYPAFVAVEAGLNIPNEVMAHPALESLRSLAAESLVLTNVSSISLGCHGYILYI
jgi:hypothetical protein